MKSKYHKIIDFFLALLLSLGGFYVTGNQPDGKLLLTFILLSIWVIMYPIIIFLSNPGKLFPTILLHVILFTLAAIFGMILRRTGLSEMGTIIYYLYPVGIVKAILLSYPMVFILKKINKPKQDRKPIR